MCGIAGIFDLQQQREPDRELLAAMNRLPWEWILGPTMHAIFRCLYQTRHTVLLLFQRLA